MSDFVTMLREGAGASQRHRGGSAVAGMVSSPRSASGAMGNNSTGTRNGARAGIGGGGPPGGGGDPPGDGGDDGDDQGTGAAPAAVPAASPEAQEQEALIRRMVIAAMHTIDNSPMFKRVVEEHALRQHQLSMDRDADMLEQQGRIAALAMEKQEVLAGTDRGAARSTSRTDAEGRAAAFR